MHWVVLLGGEALRASGKILHRMSVKHCSPQQLGETLDQSMQSLYSYPDGLDPPAPHLRTWVLGFQAQDASTIEDKVVPLLVGRMERLGICWKYDAFYEDDPEGFPKYNVLSHEKCMAWFASVADHLMDSRVEKEIALYEFSDRPEGFSKPCLPEAQEPWQQVRVAFVNAALRNEGTVSPNRLAPQLLLVNAAGAVPSRPVERGNDTTAEDGAGPSRPSNPLMKPINSGIAPRNSKEQKIAGIRAALQYNGYPSDVIEDLIQNKLSLWVHKRAYCRWQLRLPCGKTARSYGDIDANPYPGGKITEISARKCFRSENCVLAFGHLGGCSSIDTSNIDIDAEMVKKLKIAGIRAALQYNGYPSDVIEDLIQNKLTLWHDTTRNSFHWKLEFSNGKMAYSYGNIDANPYPRGKIIEKAARKCHKSEICTQPFGHKGCCFESVNDTDAENGDELDYQNNENSVSSQVVAGQEEERWLERQQQHGDGGGGRGGFAASEDLDGNEVLSSGGDSIEDYAGSFGFSDCSSDSEEEEQQEGVNGGVESRSKRLVANLPPGAVADNGAGPSKPNILGNNLKLPESEWETVKKLKVAGIRAALQYNGYPVDVIEDLIQNKLKLWQLKQWHSFKWALYLPNGKMACTYGDIDAYPYPGGKITEISARKCFKSEDCTRPYGHGGSCVIPKSADDLNTHIDLQMHHATAGVRTALKYAGYPIEVINKMMENDFGIVAHPKWKKTTKYYWSLKLPNGNHVVKLTHILNNPYPGATLPANPVCHTLGCGKIIGHRGRCKGPHFEWYKHEVEDNPASPSPSKKRPRAVSPSPVPNKLPGSILSSSSDEEAEENEDSGNEESPIYLLTTTEEEDNGDGENDDEYRSFWSKASGKFYEMQEDDDLVLDLCLEFLEAFIHQTLYQREIYSPSLFERRRLYGIAIRRARHPDLVQYIQEIVANLKTPLRQNTLAKVAIVISAPDTQGPALERFIIEPKLLFPPSTASRSVAAAGSTAASNNLDILEFESQLRAILLKLQYIDAALPPKPPLGSTFQIVAYTGGRSGMAVDTWVEEQTPLSEQGLEMKEKEEDDGGSGGSCIAGGEIVPIKSCRIEGALQLQVYVERPP